MSGTLRNYMAVTLTVGGRVRSYGSLQEPVGEATIDGDYALLGDPITIGPEDEYVVWDQSMSDLLFQQIGFVLLGEGTLQVAWRTDRPTSSTDYTPLGTLQRWRHKDWACKGCPFWLWGQTALGHGTAATETGDTGGLPTLWQSGLGAAETVIIDKLAVRNPDDTDSVVIQRLIAQ